MDEWNWDHNAYGELEFTHYQEELQQREEESLNSIAPVAWRDMPPLTDDELPF